MKFKKGETVIYPQHGACIVQGTQKKTMFGETKEYLVLRSVIGEMTLSVPLDKTERRTRYSFVSPNMVFFCVPCTMHAPCWG